MAREFVLKTKSGASLKVGVGDSLGGGFWKWENDVPKRFTIKSPIRKGAAFTGSNITTAPDVVTVTDLEDGIDKQLLVGKVLMSTLTEQYPDDSYVGQSFQCTQGPPPQGKRYKGMDVKPLTIIGDADPEEAPAKSKKK